MSKQLAVVGSPIEHSKSPQIHAAAYSALGLDWNYGKTQLKQGQLLQFVESLDETWLGLSVTMPLKYEAARIAHEKHDDVIATSVANTLMRVDERWRAFNTDVFGIQQALNQELNDSLKTVLVIGSGATATSALYALARSAPTVRVTIVARNAKAANELKSKFPELRTRVGNWRSLGKCLSTHDLVISTVPAISLKRSVQRLKTSWLHKPKGVLLDVPYDPWPSDAAKLWQDSNLKVVSGIEMLIFQAIAQCRIFLNQDPYTELPNERAVELAMRHSIGLI